jgi:tetratricopeptide (TPR) repeat protein
MNDLKRKMLDECSDESERFENQFERLFEGEGDEPARARLVAEITDWLQDIARQGRFIPLGSADRRAFRSMLERWSSRLRRQGFHLEGFDSLADFDPDAGIVLTGDCPYPGLEPYTQNRRGSFFGRERLISSSVSHLEQQGNQILLIIGASGSGKSSLALAGILPRLMEIHDGVWLFGPRLTPGAHPLAELAESIAQAIGRPDQAIEIGRSLVAKPEEALGRLAELCQGKPLMLFVDQFEELLTLCRDASEQSAFARVLCALSDPSPSASGFSCRILLTLRTDHLARFENNNALKPLHIRLVGENNERYLSAIGFGDIKRAIKEPAEEVGLRFFPAGLVDQLASQTAGISNGLPLLQFALRRLWNTRPKNESGQPLDLVTENMVRELPDVEGALGTVAEGLFHKFSAPQKRICERLLLELMVLDESFEEPLRRRRNEPELVQVLQTLFPGPDDVTRVIDEFVASGLLRRFGDRPSSQLEVAHEALLRHWDHIYRLVTGAEAKERLHLVKQIGRQAGEWASHDKASDYLSLRGDRLHRALGYAKDGWLAEAEAKAYVDACKRHEGRTKRLRQVAWGAGAVALALFLVVIYLLLWWRSAEMQRIATASNLVSYGFYYLLQADDPENAKKNFDAADKHGQGQVLVAKLALGSICLKGGNYKEAKTHFEKAISLTLEKEKQKDSQKDPVLYTYYYNKGKSCLGLAERTEAKDAFIEAIKLLKARNPSDKNLDDYLYHHGLSCRDLEEMKDAEGAFREGISLHGAKEAANRAGLGQVYFRKNDFQAASAEFEKAIHLSVEARNKAYKELDDYYYQLGLSCLSFGEMQNAEEAFKNGASLGGDMEAANRDGLGQVYFRKKDFQAASTEFAKAIELSEKEQIAPNLPNYRLSLAKANLSLGRYAKAEMECRSTIADTNLRPEDKGKAYTLLGNALAAQENYESAIEAYINAGKSNPKDAFVALYLADAYSRNKNLLEAKEYVERAEELAKSDSRLEAPEAKNFFDPKIKQLKDKLNISR